MSVCTAQTRVGNKIEISSVSIALRKDMVKRISQSGRTTLIVGYGYDHPSKRLCGVRGSRFVNVWCRAGGVDLSINVAFPTLRWFATAEAKFKRTDPVGQDTFLKNVGMSMHRHGMLVQNTEAEKVQQDRSETLAYCDLNEGWMVSFSRLRSKRV